MTNSTENNMNIEKACKIMGFSYVYLEDISIDEIKKKYRSLILKYHPDKINQHAGGGGGGVGNDTNNVENAGENDIEKNNMRFIEIHEAYHFIINHKKLFGDYLSRSSDESIHSMSMPWESEKSMDMKNIFLLFWKNPVIYTLLSNVLVNIWENKLPHYLNKLDTTNLKKIYQIVNKYFPQNVYILNAIEKVLEEKTDSLIILNPNLDDLLESNIYKLKIDGETYLVPLWHNELVFEKNNAEKEIIIQCCPLLSQNMEIDDNNLIINLALSVREVFDNSNVEVWLSRKHKVCFDGRQLKMISGVQQIVLCNEGIPAINEKNIYDIGIKKDIILMIYLDI